MCLSKEGEIEVRLAPDNIELSLMPRLDTGYHLASREEGARFGAALRSQWASASYSPASILTVSMRVGHISNGGAKFAGRREYSIVRK